MAKPPTAQIAYDGESLRDGSMDVRDLAPALLAIGNLLQNSNRVINADRADLAVKVRSDFETGSFEIYFELIQSLSSQAHMFITGEHLKTAQQIAELVGLTTGGGGGVIGVLKLFKMLKGKRPIPGTSLQNGNIEVHFHGDGNRVKIKPEVWHLANDSAVQKSAADVMKPLESSGVDTLEVRKGKKVLETLTRDDLPSFSPPAPVVQELQNVDAERITAMEIIKPSFQNDLTWVFSDGSGGANQCINGRR